MNNINYTKIRAVNAAIWKGDLAIVKDHLDNDDDTLNAGCELGSWLHAAAYEGELKIVKYLMERGLSVNAKSGPGNNKPICSAVANGHTEIVEYLMANGADIDTDHPRSNPLYDAILENRIELAKILIDTGMDTSIRYTTETMTDMSVIDFAREYDRTEIIEMLMEIEK